MLGVVDSAVMAGLPTAKPPKLIWGFLPSVFLSTITLAVVAV